MHRTIHISLPSEDADEVSRKLLALDAVVSLSILRGVSLKPKGDVIALDVLNRGADDVLKIVAETTDQEDFSITTNEAASLIDPSQKEILKDDVDEAVWEEVIIGLRHQGQVTTNFILLMICGGAIAAVGLISDPVPMMMAFAAAGIVSPGFEPIVGVPLGLVFKRGAIVRRAASSFLVGYAALILSAALIIWLLLTTGSVQKSELTTSPDIESMITPGLKEMIVSGFGAISGIVITSSYRRSVIAGALIALVFIPAATIIGAGVAVLDTKLILGGLMRLGIDVVLIVGLGLLIFGLKQYFVHRRKSLI